VNSIATVTALVVCSIIIHVLSLPDEHEKHGQYHSQLDKTFSAVWLKKIFIFHLAACSKGIVTMYIKRLASL